MLQKRKPKAFHWIDAFRRQGVRKPGRNCPTASLGNNTALKLPVQLRRTKLHEDWLSALRSADLDKVRSSVAYAFVADDHSRSTRVGLAIRHGNIHLSHLCLDLFNRIAQTLGPVPQLQSFWRAPSRRDEAVCSTNPQCPGRNSGQPSKKSSISPEKVSASVNEGVNKAEQSTSIKRLFILVSQS